MNYNISSHKSYNLTDALLFLTGVLMPCQIITFKIIPLFVIPLLFIYIIKLWYRSNIRLNKVAVFLLSTHLITFVLMLISNLPGSWKKASIIQSCLFFSILFIMFMKFTTHERGRIIKGLKYGILINLYWAIGQIVLYYIMKLDINDLIFTKLLKMREVSSSFNYQINQFSASGLNWHPAQLAPVIIFGFFILEGYWNKILIIVVAVLSTNTTCIISVFIFTFLLAIRAIWKVLKSGKITRKATIAMLAVVIVLFAIFLAIKNTSIFNYLFYRFESLLGRLYSAITRTGMNNSTSIHLSYYFSYPDIFANSGIMELLFGYGFECSGYPYELMFRYNPDLPNWVVESDLINFIVGRGYIWTFGYYFIVIRTIIKGNKITYKYLMVVATLIICGIFYNNHFLWVECLMFLIVEAVRQKEDLFATVNKSFFATYETVSLVLRKGE